LLSEGERTSVEPIAARAVGNTEGVDAVHQRLLHFITDSTWDDHAVPARHLHVDSSHAHQGVSFLT
jgi:SRSO17 transposase